MIRSEYGEFSIDSTGREMYAYDKRNKTEFSLAANDYCLTHVIPHWHAAFEVFLLLEGNVKVLTNGAEHILGAGEGCFINSGVLHEFVSCDGAPHAYRSFVFDASIVSGMVGSVYDIGYVRPLTERGPEFVAFRKNDAAAEFVPMFERAFSACEKEPPAYEFVVRNALSDIVLLAAASMWPAKPLARAQDGLVKKMIEYIDGHLKEKITLKDIADSAAVSQRECQRIFERYLRRSPISYLNMRRVYAAAEALVRDDTPVTEIAMEYCFESPSYFSSRFRRALNMTPSEYRRAHTGGEARRQ